MKNANEWNFENYYIELGGHDYDLNTINFYNMDDVLLGKVYPADIEDMNELVTELNNGTNPIQDRWEDGNGNTVNINGW